MHQQASVSNARSGRALLGSWFTAALACLGLLVPKCPLCVAAYLGLFGFSASSAQAVAKLGLPLCVALIAGSALATAWFVARRSWRRPARVDSERSCCRSAR